MIFEVDDILVSTEILEQHFICDLNACKGACCIEGDEGAPIDAEEIKVLQENLPAILPYMTPQAKEYLAQKQQIAYSVAENDWAVEMLPSGSCIFAFWQPSNQVACAIQAAFLDGKSTFQKPISCHLYPIRVSNVGGKIALNYHRWSICYAACKLGSKQKVKVYQFLRNPLIKAFGEPFFAHLCEVDKALTDQKN